MQFICQIVLVPDLFGGISGRTAYIFMTHHEGDEWMDGTWEADGGENAVIVQPGMAAVPTQQIKEGPTLYAMVETPGQNRLRPISIEFAVNLTPTEDPDFVEQGQRAKWDDGHWKRYQAALEGNKIGGTPFFIQNDEFPRDTSRKLLLQLDSARVPFYINFGDAGVGYAFLSEDGQSGKFLWQCY